MEKRILFFLFGLVSILSSAGAQNVVVDLDKNNYKVVAIGNQQWFSSNLNVSKFNNGDVIPVATTLLEWGQACINKKPVCCYYGFNVKNASKYGKLYNWFAVNDARGLAPDGWRIPGSNDINTLLSFLGEESKAGYFLKSATGWNAYTWDYGGNNKGQQDGNGIDSLGFKAVPGGLFNVNESIQQGEVAAFWTNAEVSSYEAKGFYFSNSNKNLIQWAYDKYYGLSVRCVK